MRQALWGPRRGTSRPVLRKLAGETSWHRPVVPEDIQRGDGRDDARLHAARSGPAVSGLSHVDARGQARMVDVSAKPVTAREATAVGRVICSPEVIALLRGDGVPKGDALAVARLAGIQAAKRTPELIPLAHPVAVHGVVVELEVGPDAVEVRATVRTADRTGVEMEALTCVAVAALALIDMIKAVDKRAVISDVRVVAKSGGRSGDWTRD